MIPDAYPNIPPGDRRDVGGMKSDRRTLPPTRGSLRKCAILACLGVLLSGPAVCLASEEWKAEFEAVCSKTDGLMDMQESEIASLLERCDKLAAGLEAESETVRKVNQRRLKNCCDLIRFMLDSKRTQQGAGGTK